MMKRMKQAALVLGLAALLAGCTKDSEKLAILARAKQLQVAPEYVIGEGDALTITILGQDQPSISATVRPDGKISFPGHGDIKVVEKTVEQLRTELEVAFQESLGLRKPKLHISVDAFASKHVTVLGQVSRPGRYPYTGQMRVADLLGLVIGVDPLTGSPNRALLFREIEGNTKIYKVYLKDFFEKGDFSTNFYVRPGDVLWVPMNGFAEVNIVITKIFSPIGAIVDGIGLGRTLTAVFIPGTY
jgi:polysaccharide export outer membrane protein